MSIRVSGAVQVGEPRTVADTMFVPDNANDYTYAPSPDGSKLLVIRPQNDQANSPLNVVLNWTAALKK